MKTPSYGETRTQRGCASLQEIQGSCFCLCRTQKESLLPCRRHRPSLAAPRLGEKKLERPRPQEEAERAAPPSSVSFAHVRGLNLHQDSPRTPGTGPSPRRAAPRRTAQALGEHWLLHFLLPNLRMRQPCPTSAPQPPRISGSS